MMIKDCRVDADHLEVGERSKAFYRGRISQIISLGKIPQRRAKKFCEAFCKCILPGTNVLRPQLLHHQGNAYLVYPQQRRSFHDAPSEYICCLPTEALLHLAGSAIAALDVLARNGYVHGALSPDSFVLTAMGEGVLSAVLCDGLSLATFGSTGSRYPAPYTPPEMSRPMAFPTAKSDVFALGVVLHFWCSGKLPRCRDAVLAPDNATGFLVSSAIPDPLYSMISSMLQVDPENRPTTETLLQVLHTEKNTEKMPEDYFFDSGMEQEERELIAKELLRRDVQLAQRYLGDSSAARHHRRNRQAP